MCQRRWTSRSECFGYARKHGGLAWLGASVSPFWMWGQRDAFALALLEQRREASRRERANMAQQSAYRSAHGLPPCGPRPATQPSVTTPPRTSQRESTSIGSSLKRPRPDTSALPHPLRGTSNTLASAAVASTGSTAVAESLREGVVRFWCKWDARQKSLHAHCDRARSCVVGRAHRT